MASRERRHRPWATRQAVADTGAKRLWRHSRRASAGSGLCESSHALPGTAWRSAVVSEAVMR